jgi:hypothetical protein
MQLIGKQPILSIIGLLAPIIIKITEALKDNQTAMDAVKRLMSSLDPIMKLFEKALEGVAKAVAKVADWLGRMIGKVTERFTQAKEEAENLGDAVTEGIEEATPDAVKAAENMGEKMAEAIENKLMEIDWDKVSSANAKRLEAEKKIGSRHVCRSVTLCNVRPVDNVRCAVVCDYNIRRSEISVADLIVLRESFKTCVKLVSCGSVERGLTYLSVHLILELIEKRGRLRMNGHLNINEKIHIFVYFIGIFRNEMRKRCSFDISRNDCPSVVKLHYFNNFRNVDRGFFHTGLI